MVKHAQHLDTVKSDAINNYERGAGHNQFTRTPHPPGAPQAGILDKILDGLANTLCRVPCRLGIILGDIRASGREVV
jgi:hypothetical protein